MQQRFINPVSLNVTKAWPRVKRVLFNTIGILLLIWFILPQDLYTQQLKLGLSLISIAMNLSYCFVHVWNLPETGLAIDEADRGIWVADLKHHQMLYVPFEFITSVKQTNFDLSISFKRAFYYDRKNKIRIRLKATTTIPLSYMPLKGFNNFVPSYNKLVPNEFKLTSRIRTKEKANTPKVNRSWLILAGILFGLFLIRGLASQGPSLPARSPVFSQKYQKVVDYKPGMKLKTRDYHMTIKQIYKATSFDDDPIYIAQISVKQRKDDVKSYLSDDSFVMVNKPSEVKSYDDNETLDSVTIKKNGQQVPVINLLHTEDLVIESKSKITFNVAFKFDPDNKTAYLVYAPFSASHGTPDSDDDRPFTFIKFKPSQLKEIK
ncbi:MAG: hypothetical protein Q4B66_00025 [Ligilactobacillus agilis]|nr:hypothetical protein [Ligilactobacillus agilis]